jgi:hypothetical protein
MSCTRSQSHAVATEPLRGARILVIGGTTPLPTVFSLTLLSTAKRFSRVPSMFDSLGVEVPYLT